MPVKTWPLLKALLRHASRSRPARRAPAWGTSQGNPVAGFLPPLRERNALRRGRTTSRARTALGNSR